MFSILSILWKYFFECQHQKSNIKTKYRSSAADSGTDRQTIAQGHFWHSRMVYYSDSASDSDSDSDTAPPHTVEVKLRPSDGWSVSFDVNVVTFIMSARPREQDETWLSPVHHLSQRLGIRLVMPQNPWPRVPFGVMLFPLQMTYTRLALARN